MSSSLPSSPVFRWSMAGAGALSLALAIRPYSLGLLSFAVGFFFVSSARTTRGAVEGALIGMGLAAIVAAGALTFIFVALQNFWQVSTGKGVAILLLYGALSTPELPFFFALAPLARAAERRLPACLKPLYWAAVYIALEFVFLKFRTSHHEIAYPLVQYRFLAPLASFAGLPFLGFLAFACGASLSFLAWPGTRTARRVNCLTPFPLLGVALLWALQSRPEAPRGELSVGLVQISEHDKELRAERGDSRAATELGDELVGDSRKLIAEKHPALVLWPETAIPVPLGTPDGDSLLARARALAEESRTALLLGALERQGDRIYNSAVFISENGETAVVYHKSHLFPFGETVPLAEIFPSLYRFNPEARFYRAGEGSRLATLRIRGHDYRVGIFICQETQIPEYVRAFGDADFLVNLGKDSWFGNSDEPVYHFNESAARAVETGLAVVRATNSGFSGLLLPSGEKYQTGPLFERVSAVVAVPLFGARGTPYARLGDWFAWCCLLVSLSPLACYLVGKRRTP